MKKKLLFIILALLGMTQAVSQEYEYVPFVRDGVKWVYYFINADDYIPVSPVLPQGTEFFTLELKGDTVIEGKTYKAMHKYHGTAINSENDTIPIYLREENKIVYGIVKDGKTYANCPINCCDNQEFYSLMKEGKEFVLYDFNDPVAFNYSMSGYYQYSFANNLDPFKFNDMITVNDHEVNRYVFSLGGFGDYCFIEGIGYDGLYNGYTLAYQFDRFPSDRFVCLSHVIEDGEIIYRSERELARSTYASYLPLARADVTWVNEHVRIADGDTTSYYYTYKMKPAGNAAGDYYCYYSCDDEANLVVEDLVSQVGEDNIGFICSNNKVLKPYLEKSENLINFEAYGEGTYLLYSFNNSSISYYCPVNYYIEHQKENILSHENFVEVGPLTIEGMQCSRYAYVKENGDTMCYVVEGIGFDSRNMGDLLTPFTREPDPDADYQEYCGLCHVVKDGQIIYKGMRYTPDNMTGVDEVVAEQPQARKYDDNYYNLMGQPVGKTLPTTPGIYIHQGKKIVIR